MLQMLLSALLATERSTADAAVPSGNVPTRAWGEQLVAEHYDFIWRLLRRMGLTASDADDAAQQVFLVALSPREKSIKAGSERSFLFGVALRVCQEQRRKRARSATHDDVPLDLAADGHQPDELSARQQAWQRLQTILDEMPDDIRVSFVLFELEGLTAPEIAKLVAAPVGTVASRLRRGRELFQNAVQSLEQSIQVETEARP
jgi:RNA polymerase sigma-70 factor (ECF subfamily)